jgi:uncharacterized protein YkwD
MAFAPPANSQQRVGVRNADRPAAGSVELQIFELVNRQREHERLSRLTWNDEIADVARAYSERMAREGFFDHYDPEGRTAIDRAEKVRGWRMIGENLFVCEPVPDLAPFALRGWMASETHRTNLLDKQWTSTGIGIAQASNGDLYITELFTRK